MSLYGNLYNEFDNHERLQKMKKELIELRVNGRSHELAVEPSELLLDVLRRDLQLTGSKRGCDDSSCGACTVLVDGVPTLSCTMLAFSAAADESDHSGYYDGGRHCRSRCAGGYPESLWRLGRRTMRLLHARFYDHGEGAAGSQS